MTLSISLEWQLVEFQAAGPQTEQRRDPDPYNVTIVNVNATLLIVYPHLS